MPIRRLHSCSAATMLVPIITWLTLLFLHGGEIFKGESAHGGPPECICFHDGLQASSVQGEKKRTTTKRVSEQVDQLDYMR